LPFKPVAEPIRSPVPAPVVNVPVPPTLYAPKLRLPVPDSVVEVFAEIFSERFAVIPVPLIVIVP
jgi:hypothetical protein